MASLSALSLHHRLISKIRCILHVTETIMYIVSEWACFNTLWRNWNYGLDFCLLGASSNVRRVYLDYSLSHYLLCTRCPTEKERERKCFIQYVTKWVDLRYKESGLYWVPARRPEADKCCFGLVTILMYRLGWLVRI